MNEWLADWCGEAGVGLSADELTRREQGIDSYIESVEDDREFLHLLRFCRSLPSCDTHIVDRFQQALKRADPALRMKGNDHELRVMAEAAVGTYIGNFGYSSVNLVALAVLTGSLQAPRAALPFADILAMAQRHLRGESAKLRDFHEIPTVTAGNGIEQVLATYQKATPASGSDLNQNHSAITSAVSTIIEAFNQLAASTNEALHRVELAERCLAEETNMLWWLFAGHSRDLDCRVSELSPAMAGLVVGKELADLTLVLPGPLAARAFLDRMLRDAGHDPAQETTLRAAVTATDPEWQHSWADMYVTNLHSSVEDFCPLFYASKHASRTGAEAWLPSFAAATGLTGEESLKVLDIAQQGYWESLLLKFAGRFETEEQ